MPESEYFGQIEEKEIERYSGVVDIMSKARQKRLRQAKAWFQTQHFTEDSHIVKAYRQKFKVDNTCAMRELCMLKVLSPEKQAAYENIVKAKDAKRRKKKQNTEQSVIYNPEQDDMFYYIAGFTSGGAPYGITWDEAREKGLLEDEEE